MVKKSSSSKITSQFFGMLLLVAGLGAGIVLVTQPQLLGQKAQQTNYNTCDYYGRGCTHTTTTRIGCQSPFKMCKKVTEYTTCPGSSTPCMSSTETSCWFRGCSTSFDVCKTDSDCLKLTNNSAYKCIDAGNGYKSCVK